MKWCELEVRRPMAILPSTNYQSSFQLLTKILGSAENNVSNELQNKVVVVFSH